MAGVYTDIPGTRFALDQDGSILKWRNYTTSSAWTDVSASLSETQKVNTANAADLSVPGWETVQATLAFPEPRTINAIYSHLGHSDSRDNSSSFVWEYSTDTTDGTDGSWSVFTVTYANIAQHDNIADIPKPYYRSDLATVALSNVRGIRIRWRGSGGYNGVAKIFVLHIYGSRPSASVDRLAFWNPSTDNALTAAYLDFGDIAQGTSLTRQFRIKNLSGTLAASSISVSVSDLLPEYGSGGIQVSSDNTTYSTSINIGNLAAGTISPVLYVRRTVPAAETTTQRHARLLANAASWS